jgi:hypothetical protein
MNDADQAFIFGTAGNIGWQPSNQAVHLWDDLRL